MRDEFLTNGDKFVLFKRIDAVSFFQMIDTHFEELKHNEQDGGVVQEEVRHGDEHKMQGEEVQGRIMNVEEDSSVQLKVDSMRSDNSCLKIVAECMNEFSSYYPKMSFRDWSKVIEKYLSQK